MRVHGEGRVKALAVLVACAVAAVALDYRRFKRSRGLA